MSVTACMAVSFSKRLAAHEQRFSGKREDFSLVESTMDDWILFLGSTQAQLSSMRRASRDPQLCDSRTWCPYRVRFRAKASSLLLCVGKYGLWCQRVKIVPRDPT